MAKTSSREQEFYKCVSVMMDVLNGLEAIIYIDDVFITDDTEKKHLEKLQKVIKRLTVAGLKLNLKKCQF